jgi:hypothetical protein
MLELIWALLGKLIVDVSLQVFNSDVSLHIFNSEFILLFGCYQCRSQEPG